MRLVEAGYNIETVTGQDIPTDANHEGSCMFWRPDNGLLQIKTRHEGSSNWSKLAKFNPYSKSLIYKTQSSGLARNLIYGWDYDNNQIIVHYHEAWYSRYIFSMSDGSENLTTLFNWNAGADWYPRAIFRANNEYFILMHDGWVWRRTVGNPAVQTSPGDFFSPFGTDTSSMCYAGNGRVYFTRSSGGNKKISEYKLTPGLAPQPIRTLDWPTAIPAVVTTGEKVDIAADFGNHIWLGVFIPSSGAYNIYKIDTTPVPAILVVDEQPNFLSANGQSIGVITARTLDASGIALPNQLVRVSPSGSYLTGSSLLHPITGADVAVVSGTTNISGTVNFNYRAPTVTGTQNFIVEVIS